MKHSLGKTVVFITAMLVSGSLFAHAGEHGASGLLAEIPHLLAEHGYLALLALGGLGAILLRRSRKV